MRYFKTLLFLFVLFVGKSNFLFAQQNDSLRKVMSHTNLFAEKKDSVVQAPQKDSLTQLKKGADTIAKNAMQPARDTFFLFRKKHTPKGATLRSLILPGWGQIYNHRYWEAPLAVAAVGIPIYLYISNSREYKSASTAYNVAYASLPYGTYPGATGQAVNLNAMQTKFANFYNEVQAVYPGQQGQLYFLQQIQSYRNTFRQYMDYSLLFSVILWGVQVADATVFGHLREFDVSPNLSMKVAPTYFPVAKIPGVTVTMDIK